MLSRKLVYALVYTLSCMLSFVLSLSLSRTLSSSRTFVCSCILSRTLSNTLYPGSTAVWSVVMFVFVFVFCFFFAHHHSHTYTRHSRLLPVLCVFSIWVRVHHLCVCIHSDKIKIRVLLISGVSFPLLHHFCGSPFCRTVGSAYEQEIDETTYFLMQWGIRVEGWAVDFFQSSV
jgi:hypothetical protein